MNQHFNHHNYQARPIYRTFSARSGVVLLIMAAFLSVWSTACKKKDLKENRKPGVVFVNPLTNTEYECHVGDTLQVIAAPYDLDGTISKVGLFINDSLIGEMFQAPWTLSVIAGHWGYSRLGLKAWDNQGGSGHMAITHIRVLEDYPGLVVVMGSPQYKLEAGNAFTIMGTYQYHIPGVPYFELFLDGAAVLRDTLTTIRFTTNALQPGKHTYYAQLTNRFGRQYKSETNTIDVVAPTQSHGFRLNPSEESNIDLHPEPVEQASSAAQDGTIDKSNNNNQLKQSK